MNTPSLMVLAWKNLMRYRRRTFITAGAMAFGLCSYVLADSLIKGVEIESERNLRWYETGDGLAAQPGYREDREESPLKYPFAPWELMEKLDKKKVSYAQRIVFTGDMVFYRDPFPEDGSLPVRITALDPQKDSDVFRLEETLWKGRWLEKGREEAVLGRWFAESIGADLGHPFTIITRTQGGYFQTIDLEVAGILDSRNPLINQEGFYIPLDIADLALEMEGRITALHLGIPGTEQRGSPLPALQELVEAEGLEFSDWKAQAQDYLASLQADQAGNGIVIFLLLIIAGVGISNTMLMAVLERSRELGMMRALGMRAGQIRALFLWEALGIGFLGSLMGLSLGAFLTYFLVNQGLEISPELQDMDIGYRASGHFYGAWHFLGYLYALFWGLGLSLGVAWVSTRHLLKLSIPAVLRFV